MHALVEKMTNLRLLSYLQELNVLQPKAGFRLWLTAEVHARFPPILLQSTLKITYEVGKQLTFTDVKAIKLIYEASVIKAGLVLIVLLLFNNQAYHMDGWMDGWLYR